MLIDVLKAFLALGIMGLIFGVALSIAGNVFYVQEDKRKEKVLAILPGANCGGCGYAGCSNYADAVIAGEAPCNKCLAAKSEGAAAIAELLGVDSVSVKPMVAHIRCHGSHEFANKKYIYYGMNDCLAASRLLGGYMTCQYGCLGFGNCVKKCPENAISIRNGVAVVDRDACIGCGLCLKACPKGVIELIPFDGAVFVDCSNKDRGSRTREACNIGCIGCKICEKSCPEGAIHLEGNVSLIDYEKCTGCGICAQNCPRKIIELN
ncbi:MAG: RnfABCDGE type electron transport complex subunit B [Clostridia bacterium]|nr:RnfABCDGE type electron transport complex subunit B [Clostridia bacterium]